MRVLHRQATGFTLVETLVAMTVMVTVLTGLAELLAMSVRQTRDAAHDQLALAAADAKLEWLRARTWSFDVDGGRLSDPALVRSPAGTLDRTTPGCSDGLDESGRLVTTGAPAAWLRRWAITPVDASGLDVIAIEVCAFRSASSSSGALSAPVCLATIRSRRP